MIGMPAARNPPKTKHHHQQADRQRDEFTAHQVLLHLPGDRGEQQGAAADLAAAAGHDLGDLRRQFGQPLLSRVQRGVLDVIGQVGFQGGRDQETVPVLGNQAGGRRRARPARDDQWIDDGGHSVDRQQVLPGRGERLDQGRVGRVGVLGDQAQRGAGRAGRVQDRPALGRFAVDGRVPGLQPGEQALAENAGCRGEGDDRQDQPAEDDQSGSAGDPSAQRC